MHSTSNHYATDSVVVLYYVGCVVVSEVISFVMILAMLVVMFIVLALYAVPAGGEQMEGISIR